MSKAEHFVDGWMRHRSVFLELLDKFGEEHVNFKPWPEASTLGALAVHIAGSSRMFVRLVKNGHFVPSNSKPEFSTMADVRNIVRDITEQTKADLLSLTDEQYDGMVDATQSFLGFSAPGKVFLGTMRDHEIHHKGQLFVYARMVGVEPPFFVKR